jgi:muramoyltetrapeptide carboxypeptidase
LTLPLVKPARLSPGATLGVVSLSSPVAALCPGRFERACAALRGLGYQLRVPEAARARHRYMAGTVEMRVRSLIELWEDDGVHAILSCIGGHSTHQLLEHLPFERFRARPKAFIGYSDTTTLQLALYSQAGLVSFYGPALMPQFGEHGGPTPYTAQCFAQVLHAPGVGPVPRAPGWIDERLRWDEADTRPRALIPGNSRRCLRAGSARGPLVVANAGCLLLLAGTRYFPELQGSVLILEEDESESPSTIDRYFTQLRHLGVFERIAALGVGRFPREVQLEDEALDEIIERSVGPRPIPIALGLEVGHVEPVATLPIGTQAELDAGGCSLLLLESPTSG